MNIEAIISPLNAFSVCVANFFITLPFSPFANGLKKVNSKTEVFFIDFF